jgi:hypothetical protein
MPERNAAFRAYLQEASGARNGTFPLLAGLALIGVSHVVPLAAAMMIAATWDVAFDRFESRTGIALVLLGVAWLLPATALVLRVVHRRPPAGVLGIGGAVSWRQFGRAFALTAAVLFVCTLMGLLYDPRIGRGPAPLAGWAAFAPLFAGLILLQVAAEEVFFRGYLVQTLAARFRGPLIWCGLPAVLFTLLHWNADVSTAMNLSGMATIATFAIAATLLLVKTGNLGAAMGFHFANNMIALLFFSSSNSFSAIALFVLPPIESPEWTTPDAVILAAIQIAAIVLVTILLIHERSPFRMTPDAERAAGLPRHASALPDR